MTNVIVRMDNDPSVCSRSIIGVRIDPRQLESIRNIARARRVSISWLIRYATFRYVRIQQRFPNISERLITSRVKRGESQETVAFKLCVYGADAQYLHIFARAHGVPVAQIIRRAIGLYLARLIRVVDRSLYWRGLKIYSAFHLQKKDRHGGFCLELTQRQYLLRGFWPYRWLIRGKPYRDSLMDNYPSIEQLQR